MASQSSNLFIGERTYRQSKTLVFYEKSTELKFLIETGKSQVKSAKWVWIWVLVLHSYMNSEILHNYLWLGVLFSIVLCMYIKNPVIKIIIIQAYCAYIPEYNLKKPNAIECIGIFTPSIFLNFFIVKKWTLSFLTNSIEGIAIYSLTNTNLCDIVIGIIITSLISASLEKDFRDLWYLWSSYKKSDSIHQKLWNNSDSPNFLLDFQGYVVYNNSASIQLCSPSNKSLKGIKLNSIFTNDYKTCKKIINKTTKGLIIEEEVGHNSKFKSQTSLGYLIKSILFPQDSADYIRVVCIDISMILLKRFMMINCLRTADEHLCNLNKELLMLYSKSQAVHREAITSFYSVQHIFKGAMILKNNFMSTTHQKSEHFDLHTETLNVIEKLFLKTSKSQLSIFYTKEQGIPISLIGDKSLLAEILYSILNMIIENSTSNSSIYILVQVSSLVKYDITLNYKFTFRSSKVSNLDISSMFTSKSNFLSRFDIEEMAKKLDRYGLDIVAADRILVLMKGNIVKVHSESDYNKVNVNVSLPFIIGKIKVEDCLIKISRTAVKENSLTMKWSPESYKAFKFDDEENVPVAKSVRANLSIDVCEQFYVLPCLVDETLGPKNSLLNVSTKDLQVLSHTGPIDCNYTTVNPVENPPVETALTPDPAKSQAIGTVPDTYHIEIPAVETSDPNTIENESIDIVQLIWSGQNTKTFKTHQVNTTRTILIVDTEATNLQDFDFLDTKWAIKQATSIEEGKFLYNKYNKHYIRFAGIFISLDSDLDGIQLYDYIKSNEAHKYSKTFICGMSFTLEKHLNSTQLGMNYFGILYIVLKPLTAETLKEIVIKTF